MTQTVPTHREVANRGLLVVSVMLATLMQALDTTIANVALPNMQGSLSATQDQIAWVLTSYIVAAGLLAVRSQNECTPRPNVTMCQSTLALVSSSSSASIIGFGVT